MAPKVDVGVMIAGGNGAWGGGDMGSGDVGIRLVLVGF